jgi:hypothetical protein
MEPKWPASLSKFWLNWWPHFQRTQKCVTSTHECGNTLPKKPVLYLQFGQYFNKKRAICYNIFHFQKTCGSFWQFVVQKQKVAVNVHKDIAVLQVPNGFPSGSQCVPNSTLLYSHMLCPKSSPSHLYRRAKGGGGTPSFHIESCILGSLYSFNFFFTMGQSKLAHCKNKKKLDLWGTPN